MATRREPVLAASIDLWWPPATGLEATVGPHAVFRVADTPDDYHNETYWNIHRITPRNDSNGQEHCFLR